MLMYMICYMSREVSQKSEKLPNREMEAPQIKLHNLGHLELWLEFLYVK